MPKVQALHLNPQSHTHKTACGLPLRDNGWRYDKADVTCNNCLRIAHGKI